MFRFAATIFLGAFLLFQVQPLMGRYVLPWFGGSPAVWTACMLLFQALLPAGYAYAHLSSTRLSPHAQGRLHLALLAASLVALPIIPDESWKPVVGESPTLRILTLLIVTVGGPYFMLSTTGPLVQSWFAATYPARSPLRLYALSNAGSLLALLSYPLLVEPWLTLGAQARVWSWGYVGFACVCGWTALRRWQMPNVRSSHTSAAPAIGEPTAMRPAAAADKLLWLALACVGSIMLLATTNQISQEVTVTPFLWIVPLAVYLTSFILAFDAPRWYRRDVFGPLLAVAAAAAVYALNVGPQLSFATQVTIYAGTLFICTMICHGELVRAKPDAAELTMFYLLISLGGALGGVLTALVAPRLFTGYWEYQCGLAATALLFVVAVERRRPAQLSPGARLVLRTAFVCGGVMLLSALGRQVAARDEAQLSAKRNFYGVLRVLQRSAADGPQRAMIHGRTIHGVQRLDEARRRDATTYYAPESGIGLALLRHPRRVGVEGSRGPLEVGIVGLGAGTLAAYSRPGDRYTFYEINPDVVQLAFEQFTYLADARGAIDLRLGDARVCLEQEASAAPRRFDVLAVDAFSGDAIPLHLVTRECFDVYRRRLADDGVLALHISNNSVDLTPVVVGLAREIGYEVRRVHSRADEARGVNEAVWMLVTRNAAFLAMPDVAAAATVPVLGREPIVWTDDFSSLRQVLK